MPRLKEIGRPKQSQPILLSKEFGFIFAGYTIPIHTPEAE